MPTKSVLPLLLLVLLIWNENTRVLGQKVNVAHVKTDHVELTWERSGKWLGVKEFTVQFSTPNSSVCEEVVPCQTVDCKFNSSETCGVVDACTKTTTVVSGGNYTAPEVVRVTGPESVTNFTLYIEQGVLHITWNNPSTDSSPCYNNTAVRVLFAGDLTTTYHDIDEEFQDVELCRTAAEGMVEVWTTCTDGESYAESGIFVYNSVVDLVRMEPCKPLGCTSLQASWDYLPVCSAVVSFNVTVDDDNYYAADINSTNMTITGLQPSVYYTLCVMAMNAQGSYVDRSCQTCYSISAVVNNVQAVTTRESNSALNVTWDPSPCQVNDITYDITYTSFIDWESQYTSQNSIVLDNLYDYHYNVCVKVGGAPADPVCTPGFSTISEPVIVSTSDLNDSVLRGKSPLLVWWIFYDSNYPGVNITYQLTWGSEQQYSVRTQNDSYTIQKYTNPNFEHRFCVAAIPDNKDDLMSEKECVREYAERSKNDSLGLIIGVTVPAVIIVSFLIVIVVQHFYKRRRSTQLT